PGDTGYPRPSYLPPTRNKREVASGKAALGCLTKREGRLAESLCLRLRWCVGFEKRGSPGGLPVANTRPEKVPETERHWPGRLPREAAQVHYHPTRAWRVSKIVLPMLLSTDPAIQEQNHRRTGVCPVGMDTFTHAQY